ncbi:MAG: D-alanyl-D-alanine carboxypeptidase family protein [Jatrophihabitans sp.]|uniref:D-alanyl-D-alanine carboxypeptidase family protein n=1 Tax=Jatrophihabitans sp. TaxID=1932789 RepID=UPI003911FCDC
MISTVAPAPFGPVTVHAPYRRRRRWAFVLVVVLLAAATTVAARWYLTNDSRRDYLATDGWPAVGQGAYQLGSQRPRASADQTPAPIASLAKVMTAYIVLQHLSLRSDEDGPDFVVNGSDVADTAMRRSRDESTVRVSAGERLTERDALMAVLLPSANNVAVLLARAISGSVDRFVVEMNRTAHLFGMSHTTYTDPSGFDDRTVSTAIDQLRLAQVAAAQPVLAEMMSVRSYRLPVAGTVHNTDTLLGRDGFLGMKTGSDDAAGGCFMFRSRRMVDGRAVELVGVVLGQQGRQLITAGLYSAKQLADRVAPAAAPS